MRREPTWQFRLPRGRKLLVGTRPLIMGVINCTPDSFSDGGLHDSPQEALKAGLRMVSEGADWLDVGGESTRPGALAVTAGVQIDRVRPVIAGLRRLVDVPISIDTMNPEVGVEALASGADIINDVSACADPGWLSVLRNCEVPIVLVHMQGRPQNMQEDPQYPRGVTTEVVDFFKGKLRRLKELGVEADRTLLDPGIGFGKRVKDNLELIRNIEALRTLGRPVLIGTSRKSFLRKILEGVMGDADVGTVIVNSLALLRGANVVRVHNVSYAAAMVKIFLALEGSDPVSESAGGRAPAILGGEGF